MTPEDIIKTRFAKGEIDKETYRELMAEISDQKTLNSGAETGGDGNKLRSHGSDRQITKDGHPTDKHGGESTNTGLLAKVSGAILLIAVLSGFFMMRNHQEQARLDQSTEEARQRVQDAGSISDLLNTDRPKQRENTAPQNATTPVSEFANLKTQDIIGCWTIAPYYIDYGPARITMLETNVTYDPDGTTMGYSAIDVTGSDDEMFDGRYDLNFMGTFTVENGYIASRLTDAQVEPRSTSPLSAAEKDIKRRFAEAASNIDDEIEREQIVFFSDGMMSTETPLDNGDNLRVFYNRTCR
ncbi:MAG: hypothetical protein AAGG45_06325 [Pseudomonadota bacterium]